MAGAAAAPQRRCGHGQVGPPASPAQRRPPGQRPGRSAAPRRAAVALAAVLSLLLAQGGRLQGEALALFGKGGKRVKEKVLVTYGDYELRFLRRGPGPGLTAAIPRLKLRKIPPKPVSLTSVAGSVESSLDKEILTFPFTTQNAAAVQVGFPRIAGRLRLSAQDPPASLDLEDAQRSVEASYEQHVPGVGDVSLRAKTTGEWSAGLSRQGEDLGLLRGAVNSQLDWNADLEKTYPGFKGISPTVTYGANQDGMRVRAKLDSFTDKGIHSSYTVQNLPGKYAPADFLHEGLVSVSTRSGRQTLEAQGQYDRRFSKVPVRGSLSYTARSRPLTVEASVDFDRYRLAARTRYAQATAAVGRKVELEPDAGIRGRPAELELKVGKVAASTRLGEGTPRLKVDLAL